MMFALEEAANPIVTMPQSDSQYVPVRMAADNGTWNSKERLWFCQTKTEKNVRISGIEVNESGWPGNRTPEPGAGGQERCHSVLRMVPPKPQTAPTAANTSEGVSSRMQRWSSGQVRR